MIKANLIAERVAIEAYRQMIERIGDSDPTTRHMLVGIMAKEEEHATICVICWLECRAFFCRTALARRSRFTRILRRISCWNQI